MLPLLPFGCAPLPAPTPAQTLPAPLSVDCPAGAVNVGSGEAFSELQDALDAASEGEVVAVCTGVHEGSFVAPVPVTIAGVGPAVLAGNGRGPVLTVPGGAVVLDLEVTGGRGGLVVGAGAEVVVARARVHGNVATDGGGVRVDPGGAARLVDVEIAGNEAAQGGALACEDASVVLEDTDLVGNAATHGGAVYADRCDVRGGRAVGNAAAVYGGGLALLSSTAREIQVRDNAGLYGGGVYALGSALAACEVAANVADHGDGIYAVSGLALSDTWITDHRGVGLAIGVDRVDVAGGGVRRNGIGAEASGGLGQVLVSAGTDWANDADVVWAHERFRFDAGVDFTCAAAACTSD